jgi:hypothetical protein
LIFVNIVTIPLLRQANEIFTMKLAVAALLVSSAAAFSMDMTFSLGKKKAAKKVAPKKGAAKKGAAKVSGCSIV